MLAINSFAYSAKPLNATGVAVSQGTQYWELLVANSQSVSSSALSYTTINGSGVAVDLSPKQDAKIVFELSQKVEALADSGAVYELEQLVNQKADGDFVVTYLNTTALLGSGNIWQVWQTIQLKLSVDAPEQIASFEQTIARQENSGALFYLSQRVRDLSLYQQQYKPFEIDLTVGGYQVRDDELIGDIEITRGENDAALLTFSILLAEGDVTSYVEQQGKIVVLDYTDNATGKTERLYTGKVDIPEVDFVAGIATYRCTDNRKEAINALDSTLVSQYGYWSEDVFGELPDELFDEVEQRLETIPYAFDMNRYGGLTLTSWTPKTTADYVLTDADIYRRKPSVEVLSRGRVVNKVAIEMEFQYQRLRYREQPYLFYPPNSVCNYINIGPRVPKEMMHEALRATSWAYKDMRMTDAACGSDTCNGTITRVPCGYYEGHYENKTSLERQEDGSLVSKPVLDASGQPVQEWKADRYYSTYKNYAGTASWTSYIRFSQNISEQITVTVEAPQSIAQYGEVEKRQTMGVEIEYDASDFENESEYDYDLSNFVESANGDLYLDLAYLVSANGAARWKAAYDCAINRAKTTILKSHRDNTVTIETDILPALELAHTVQINSTNWTACKGKVGAIRHIISMDDREAYTEIDIKLSRAIGSAPSEILPNHEAVRPQNRNDAPKTVKPIVLRHKIIEKDAEITDDMVGAIYRQDAYNVLAAVAINTPEIVEARDNRVFESSATIEVAIPNHDLTIRHKR